MPLRYLILVLVFFANQSYGQEARVLDLKVQGNKRLKTSFVRLISELKPGAVLDSAIIEQDIIRLKRLPSVSHAYYQVFESEPNVFNVFYTIQENFTLIPQLNVYTTNNDEFAYRVGLYEYNTLGRSVAFGGFYQKDIYDSYGVNVRAPFLFNNKVGIAFNFKHRVELGVTFFNEDYSFLTGATNPSIPQDFNIDKELYKAIYEYNGLDYSYQFTSGFKSTFNFQYVISSDATLPDFLIGWNDFQYFVRVGDFGNWASRLRLGLASNKDSPFAPFSVDNNLNIRGVGNTIDRGTGAIVLNTEYRHTVYEKDWFILQANAFIDGGTWRNPGGDFGDFSDDQNLRIYPGIGVRFIHKQIFNATFRVDYGYGITPGATSGLVFGIGQYF